jgi:hypothetical protein
MVGTSKKTGNSLLSCLSPHFIPCLGLHQKSDPLFTEENLRDVPLLWLFSAQDSALSVAYFVPCHRQSSHHHLDKPEHLFYNPLMPLPTASLPDERSTPRTARKDHSVQPAFVFFGGPSSGQLSPLPISGLEMGRAGVGHSFSFGSPHRIPHLALRTPHLPPGSCLLLSTLYSLLSASRIVPQKTLHLRLNSSLPFYKQTIY